MALGDTTGVESVLQEWENRAVVDSERYYRLVHFATFAGHPERALDHFEYATENGFFNAPYIESDPLLASLRTLPRFGRILGIALKVVVMLIHVGDRGSQRKRVRDHD